MRRHLSTFLALLALCLLGTAAFAATSLTTAPVWTDPNVLDSPGEVTPLFGDRTVTWWTIQADFLTGFPGLTMEDWSSSIAGGIVGCTGPVNCSTANECYAVGDIQCGITFTNLDPINVPGLAYIGAGAVGNPSDMLAVNYFVDGGSLAFAPAVNAVGIQWDNTYAGGLPITVNVYSGATLIGSAVVNGGNPFFTGISSDADLITSITFIGSGSYLEAVNTTWFGLFTTAVETASFSTVKNLY